MKPFVLLLALTAYGCSQRQPLPETQPASGFAGYWYQGKAELNRYKLVQQRYGQPREGEAVLIFVTEDFHRQKLVKADEPETLGNEKLPVLKLNATRNFTTGIYPYSIMSSVFTPVYASEQPHSVKWVNSVQEWCGQSYMQLSLADDKYKGNLYSYFEQEGNASYNLDAVLTEDELMNRIRIRPESIATGEQQMLPSMLHQRFAHTPYKAVQALVSNATVQTRPSFLSPQADSLQMLVVDYPSLRRKLSIYYSSRFPYKIAGWAEEQVNAKGVLETTTAALENSILSAYWQQNKLADSLARNAFINP